MGIQIVAPPPPPKNLGVLAKDINPFEYNEEILPVQDEYSVLPPVLASVARKNDLITDKLVTALDDAIATKDYKNATSLARAASYAQRIKVNAIDSTIKAADSSAHLIQARTDAELAKKTPANEHGLSPELQKELIDLIARRTVPTTLDVESVNSK